MPSDLDRKLLDTLPDPLLLVRQDGGPDGETIYEIQEKPKPGGSYKRYENDLQIPTERRAIKEV